MFYARLQSDGADMDEFERHVAELGIFATLETYSMTPAAAIFRRKNSSSQRWQPSLLSLRYRCFGVSAAAISLGAARERDSVEAAMRMRFLGFGVSTPLEEDSAL